MTYLSYNNSVKNIRFLAAQAKEASRHLALLSTEAKNEILIKIGENLLKKKKFLLQENSKDMKRGRQKSLSEGLLDRLLLTPERIEAITRDLEKVVELPDPIGDILEERERPNGLQIQRIRVPLGVVGIIYEARPNVTVDAATLCLKSGNAVILKGGSDALFSNRAITNVIKETLSVFDGLNPSRPLHHAVQLIDSTDRKVVEEFLKLRGLVDVIIPRGGKTLIDFVIQNAKVPVIETGASVVHAYVDELVNLPLAVKVVTNAKLRRTSICNTLDTLLLHQTIAEKFLGQFIQNLISEKKSLEFRADPKSYKIIEGIFKKLPKKKTALFTLHHAGLQDFDTEFLAPILAIRITKDLTSAINHIEKHSLKHSEAIITEKKENAERFLKEVDAACVYWNASTQFSDGAQFSLGAEIGISTQKLHCRGPFALEALTSYKWIIRGSGQIRPV